MKDQSIKVKLFARVNWLLEKADFIKEGRLCLGGRARLLQRD